ncbi:hypothetical protein B0T16DRAFT_429824 [Cercophora newfieldiana]|uniref:SET domain-containing protein n=1 Tax=Cercophora newfieldiana TaxID=92897 RepID=A0AA39Y1Y2_9PEZI|nr:hypothetical protein B0T16DRAFT_429824 [Cercophora newfieldiana]
MSPTELPIADLPIWARLNDVKFGDFEVRDSDGKGYGVVCRKALTTAERPLDESSALTVPHDLVLNVEAVEEYAKEDRNFKQLLDAVGHRSPRADILLFLLIQTALSSRTGHSSAGLSNPWMEYLQFLPRAVLVPSMWTEDERLLLRGTSLETAVNAKMLALVGEFDHVQSISEEIPCWNDLLWQGGAVSVRDWTRLDALYRSRCLELPKSGESMVPCIDMVNHSRDATAHYDENAKSEVTLLLRPGVTVSEGQEVTISYGEAKSAAEMLFSYGFIDQESTTEALVLPLEPFEDDPLAKAKLVGYGEAPKLHVARDGDSVVWKSPFVHLMCVNEEDGLDFRVLQDTDGGRQLRVFWQGEDATDQTKNFESLVQNHPLGAIFRLRSVTVVQERLQTQLDLALSYDTDEDIGDVRPECLEAAKTLRRIEVGILEDGIKALEREKTLLMEDENVVAYLGSAEIAESDLAGEEASSEVDDFS